jgi:hypothetical protein
MQRTLQSISFEEARGCGTCSRGALGAHRGAGTHIPAGGLRTMLVLGLLHVVVLILHPKRAV